MRTQYPPSSQDRWDYMCHKNQMNEQTKCGSTYHSITLSSSSMKPEREEEEEGPASWAAPPPIMEARVEDVETIQLLLQGGQATVSNFSIYVRAIFENYVVPTWNRSYVSFFIPVLMGSNTRRALQVWKKSTLSAHIYCLLAFLITYLHIYLHMCINYYLAVYFWDYKVICPPKIIQCPILH